MPMILEEDIPYIMQGDAEGLSKLKANKSKTIGIQFNKNANQIGRIENTINRLEMKRLANKKRFT